MPRRLLKTLLSRLWRDLFPDNSRTEIQNADVHAKFATADLKADPDAIDCDGWQDSPELQVEVKAEDRVPPERWHYALKLKP
jgi:hypothetical protein